MSDSAVYHEKVSSKKTGNLFVALALVFLLFSVWRVVSRGLDTLAVIFLFIFCLFLFYVLNFRTLVISLTAEYFRLDFGIFHWTIPLNNIDTCQHDDNMPWLMKNGGAGIHFMFVRNRYRASFNFLEYPRVVLALNHKAGPVVDVSFTTRNPDKLIQRIQEAASAV